MNDDIAELSRFVATIPDPDDGEYMTGAPKMVPLDEVRIAKKKGYREGWRDGYYAAKADVLATFQRLISEGLPPDQEDA